ncbi:sensor histidine kinase [Rubritalea marina]|uniref:sensor histidine kinase n=1 Tax=Rubritalea marina TaxID=361055 RepID=UPI0012EA23A4|nr:histidine kinase [Rubritalea marina]
MINSSTFQRDHNVQRASQRASCLCIVFYLLAGYSYLLAASPNLAELQKMSTPELENRRTQVNQTLSEISSYTMRGGVGGVGYRSMVHNDGADQHWVQINLSTSSLIDCVVLVPEIWRGWDQGFKADAFPVAFNVLAGLHGDPKGKIIAKRRLEDKILPRVAPEIIPFAPVEADWVRLEFITLSPRGWDGKRCVQLSEMYVFSGATNVALNQKITASSSEDSPYGSRHRKCLTDGFTPFIMDSNLGDRSVAFLAPVQTDEQPSITIDLESPQMVSQINMHTVEVSDSIPQVLSNDFAIPQELTVEGANHPDFRDSKVLTTYYRNSIYDTGPIISRSFAPHQCRFLRVTATKPYVDKQYSLTLSALGFAELEFLDSNGLNVALNQPVEVTFLETYSNRPEASLTDGLNIYGQILPAREWLEQLALRHDLDREKPMIAAILEDRYAKQKANLILLQWIVVILVAGTIIIILITRIGQQRAIHMTRERIAADLHDELGANLHALGLLSELAQKSQSNDAKLSRLLERIGHLTRRCGSSARYCTDMLEERHLYQNVQEEITRCSRRFLADINYTLEIIGEEHLEKLSRKQRVDFCLFHKECLANILKHSEANRVTMLLTATEHHLEFAITDNGTGIDTESAASIPEAIQRRSRLLGAQVNIQTPEGGGASIVLSLKIKKLKLL